MRGIHRSADLHNLPLNLPMNALPQPSTGSATSIADALNHGCMCHTLDTTRLQQELERDLSLSGLAGGIALNQPHLFSSSVVFLSSTTAQAIAQAISAIERVMALPAFQTAALKDAPAIAQTAFGPQGAFMGYDFHVDATNPRFNGPQLIEVNTNAGGAFLNAALARAHHACCEAMTFVMQPKAQLDGLEQTFFDMFQTEWRLQRGDQPLRTVAIVDDAPLNQFLAPEFALYRQMFSQRGVFAVIADPSELSWRDGILWCASATEGAFQAATEGASQALTPIDLVYNRLTDFDFSAPAHQALHDAYLAGGTVITPHPNAHALRANKRHLVTLSDDAQLAQWGVSEADRQTLHEAVPATQRVTRDNADALWAQRRQLFFKPAAGYAGKAAYRGEKLTKRVWDEILAGDFIAQAFAPPGQRLVNVDGVATNLKFDVRAYTYQGHIQLMVARTYQGQTTNLRTPGGGFSPMLVVPTLELTAAQQAALPQIVNLCTSC